MHEMQKGLQNLQKEISEEYRKSHPTGSVPNFEANARLYQELIQILGSYFEKKEEKEVHLHLHHPEDVENEGK